MNIKLLYITFVLSVSLCIFLFIAVFSAKQSQQVETIFLKADPQIKIVESYLSENENKELIINVIHNRKNELKKVIDIFKSKESSDNRLIGFVLVILAVQLIINLFLIVGDSRKK